MATGHPNNSPVTSSKTFEFLTKHFRPGKVVLNLPDNNKDIIDIFNKAQKDPKFEKALKTVIDEIDKSGNHLVKFAEVLKSVPEAISIAGVASPS